MGKRILRIRFVDTYVTNNFIAAFSENKYCTFQYSLQNGEAKMLVLSSDSNKLQDKRVNSLEDAIRALPDYIKLLLPHGLLNKVSMVYVLL